MNTNNETQTNGVNERVTQCNQLTPGNGAVRDQAGQGRQPVTGTRRKYSREDNRAVMKCYFRSRPEARGYRKRMFNIWKETGGFDTSEQRLADQVRVIKKDNWFTLEELDELREQVSMGMEPPRNDENSNDETDVPRVQITTGMEGESEVEAQPVVRSRAVN